MTIIAAADGSALGNPGPAGWAWYVDDGCWDAGGWPHATNNQGELMAVLQLLQATAHVDDDLLILCDSQYVINSVTKWMPGWKRKGWRKSDGAPVMNVDLLKQLDDALQGRDYQFEWVRGHVGHELNEAADARARAAAEAFRKGTPVPHGPGFTLGHAVHVDPAAAAHANPLRPEFPTVNPSPNPNPPTTGAATDLPADDDPVIDPNDNALFTLDEPAWHPFTVDLTADEYDRLHSQARKRGMTPQELLRSLI